MTIQSPGYADDGPFAINVWMKTGNASEQGPQYIFSHDAANASGRNAYNAWLPNMVLTCLPRPCTFQRAHVRTISGTLDDCCMARTLSGSLTAPVPCPLNPEGPMLTTFGS